MKKTKWIVLLPALLILFFCNVCFAAGNVTDIEQKWLEFQRALKDRQVKEGVITQEKAKSELEKLETDLKAGSEDIVYDRWKERCAKRHDFSGVLASVYAKVSGRSKEDIENTCREKNLTVMQLAQKEGNLEKLKTALISGAKEKLSELVKNGTMTQKEMDEKLEHITNKLNRFTNKIQ